jgi:hypothetical protein
MIIGNLDVRRSLFGPSKTNAPLIIDPNAMLAFAFSLQRLQMIGGRRSQIAKRHSRMPSRWEWALLPHLEGLFQLTAWYDGSTSTEMVKEI